ncbi:MAG: OsmC family protein [Thermoleophilia bacterium]|nr:OsmC family protein [Thermoleophilia bacterium]
MARVGAPLARRFEFSASIARDGSLCAEDRERLDPGEAWTPEHLLLAALCRCTLASLRFHAGAAGVEAGGSAAATGLVTKRESDGRYAFVEILCGLDVTLEREPDDVPALLARAERDCFIAASLTSAPEYEWRVNGQTLPPQPASQER